MSKFLGEEVVDVKETEFANYDKLQWAMYFIENYGQIDGGHHKAWVLDQAARIIKGTPLIIVLAKWSDGKKEYRVHTGEPSQEYLEWVKEMQGDMDEEFEPEDYYTVGIAP